MKLKLHTLNTETLKTTLALVSHIRRFVILRFTTTHLLIISVNGTSVTLEPQVWCKLQIHSIFDQIEIQSLNDNTISLEINIELFLQTLRNFDRASNSEGLSIRLQRKESSGEQGVTVNNGRTASLALFYSNTNLNSNTINHTFRIPVKILKNTHEAMFLKEPELAGVDHMMRLPQEFASTYKRLDKFRKFGNNELVSIRTSRRDGGFLGFVLEEEGSFKVTISWNNKLEIQKPRKDSEMNQNTLTGDSLRTAYRELLEGANNQDAPDDLDEDEDKEISVRLRDWRMASKIVSTCKRVIFLVAHQEACVLHCLLDDSGDVEIVYHITGTRVRSSIE
ncbi:DNA damage checkpoint control protein Mec3p [[Candida] anglica]|uniref:DNA damage checkpoint control protein Mec3p n=1 Tax=[Candida] anglica TaxID=148631 RepID=A0ABP0E6P3_9ASCO